MNFEITSNSPQQTIEIGRVIGGQLKGGEIIGITGRLGSGKTHLIKGIANGADAVETSKVTSPTFVIVNEYSGRLDIYHIDAYRINSIAEFETIGFDDFCRPDSVVVIEWSDKVESALHTLDYMKIQLTHVDQAARHIRIKNTPEYINIT